MQWSIQSWPCIFTAGNTEAKDDSKYTCTGYSAHRAERGLQEGDGTTLAVEKHERRLFSTAKPLFKEEFAEWLVLRADGKALSHLVDKLRVVPPIDQCNDQHRQRGS